MNKIFLKLFAIFLFGLLSFPSFSLAENEISILESDIYVETIPENPKAYEEITIKISSYATDLNKAMIDWKSGSTSLLSGYGKTKYSFKTSGPNTSTVIDVGIIPEGEYNRISKRIIISTTEVDLLWESVDGYTPPFYKGRSFPTAESTIKVVALPVIKTGINSSSIVYNWEQEGSAQEDSSGYNKNYFIFSNDGLKDKENISVVASSISGDYNATSEIEIPVQSPKILFYKKSPTDGILYGQALTNDTFFKEDEFTIVAEPYFLAMRDKEPLFNYSWKINSAGVETPSPKNQLTLRPVSRGGYATIGLVIERANTLFQKISGNLRINI